MSTDWKAQRTDQDNTGGKLVNKPRPSVIGTTHTLPFHQLSPRDFERLCLPTVKVWRVSIAGSGMCHRRGTQ